jgi:O-Antigen ligase
VFRAIWFPTTVAIGFGFLTLVVALVWDLRKALLWVYLPILLFVPLYMHVGFHGVYVDPATLAGTVLALMALYASIRYWQFSITDVLVALYALSAFWADGHHRPMLIALYSLIATLWATSFPYIIGKSLIEQTRSREAVAKFFVLSLAILAVISLYEFRLTSNPFQIFSETMTHVRAGWGRQRRWGFARVAGPYGHAITAGMVFTIGFLLELWLVVTKRWRVTASKFTGSQSKLRRNAKVITLAVLMGLFETQSRGPWIGCGLGLIVAVVGFTRNRKRSAIIAGVLLAITLTTAYIVLNRYTAADNYTSVQYEKDLPEEQQNAIYRRNLLTTYLPAIDRGGLWGWGYPLPDAEGLGLDRFALRQPSIDNEYLRILVVQGYAGLTIFVLLLVTTISVLVKHSLAFRRRVDITFAYALLGIVAATGFALTTVYLGLPMMQLLFLIFGWSQSLKPTDTEGGPEQLKAAASLYAFEKVYS